MVPIAWMVGALTSFAMMAVSVRELTGEMPAFQMLFIRSTLGVLHRPQPLARARPA